MFLIADNSGDTLNKKFFIIFIILFFILILSGFNIVNASDDYGISTTALITDSSVDDDNNITVSFTCNFPDEIIEKTFILSSEFRSSLDNYMIVYSCGNLHLLDTSETNAIKENTETNKGIWETIKEILSYLSPFSENFFVYKLINLLVDALKSLFIPSDDFFINWFSELNDIFSKQFGFLYYPFSVIFTFLGDLDNVLVTTEPIINVPAFEFNFFSKNVNIWDSFSYNFNDLLLIDSVKKLHTFYILFVDIIFTIGILYYARKVFIKIFK